MLRKSLLCAALLVTGCDNATSDEDTFREGLLSKEMVEMRSPSRNDGQGLTAFYGEGQQAEYHPEGHGGQEAMETRDLVRLLLVRVDVETQAAAIHSHGDGMTLEEVAALLGHSVPTIRKRLAHFSALGGEELKVP
ncbi:MULTISPECIES: sigma-70 family RNA polymerase sigma factor [Myxococcus]|uniref:sigma-70 family RNA polymerase sigma factor n=1 Tax=Myxococcus TaxID=32 RepID=UPI00114472CB|nr:MULTISPECIES: sigma-70 family RNA polymerase sigma factor [Myxococcus]NOK04541.1 sigma-70 family RNA polymerase sigma factor [Myxococcus xanthus]